MRQCGVQFLEEALESSWEAHYKLVSDEQSDIEGALKELVRLAFLIHCLHTILSKDSRGCWIDALFMCIIAR